MRITDIKTSFVKYQESIKTRGLQWIDSSLIKSEYLDYSIPDLYNAIKDEQNEHVKSVLMMILYLKVEEKNKNTVPKLSLIYSRK